MIEIQIDGTIHETNFLSVTHEINNTKPVENPTFLR